jgi:hypothetical protein
VCLRQLSLSLFLWFTARQGPWEMWQHQSSPLRKAELGVMGHMAASELTSARRRGPEVRDTWQHRSSPQQGGEVWNRGTRGSTGAHLVKEARSGAEGHVAAPELTSVRRRGPGPQDMWQHRSSPQQGGEVRGHGTGGGAGAHLCRDIWSKATTYVAARGCTSCSLS